MNAVAQQTPHTETIHVTFMAKRFTFLALCVKHTAGHQHVGEHNEIIHWWAAPLAVTWFFDVLLSEGNTFTMTPAPAVQILSVSFHASRQLTMASAFFPACQTLYSTDSTTHGKSHTSAVFALRSGCIYFVFFLFFCFHSYIPSYLSPFYVSCLCIFMILGSIST